MAGGMDGWRRIHGGFHGMIDDGCVDDGGIHRGMNGWMLYGWSDSWMRMGRMDEWMLMDAERDG